MSCTTNTKLRLLWVVCVLLAIVSQARAQSSIDLGAPDMDVIKVDTTPVTVNVSVTNTRNRHLQGLKLEDFHVTDEGKTVKPSTARDPRVSSLSLMFRLRCEGKSGSTLEPA